jgi:hypothetical protein
MSFYEKNTSVCARLSRLGAGETLYFSGLISLTKFSYSTSEANLSWLNCVVQPVTKPPRKGLERRALGEDGDIGLTQPSIFFYIRKDA